MRNPSPVIVSTAIVPARPAFPGGVALDLVSLADVKLELNIQSAGDDAWLKKAITRCSASAAAYCNRAFQIQRYRDLLWSPRSAFSWRFYLDGFMPAQLVNFPVSSAPSTAGIAPPPPPALSAVAGGSASAAVAYARAAWLTASGETAASLETGFLVPAGSLLAVAPPGPDPQGLATGWNVYAGAAPNAGTRQNSSPLPLDAGWTQGPAGFSSGGAALPDAILVVENASLPLGGAPGAVALPPQGALCEGVDFIADRGPAQLSRIFSNGYVRPWEALPLLIEYSAGYAAIPDDVQDAALLMVKFRWFARTRDPAIRTQSTPGVYESSYVMGTGPGGEYDMPAEATAKLERYRVPLVA